jgi:hypothetical protein
MKYGGILRIGFKLLVNDKPKFTALLIGITFSVFLMMMMTAMFAGILNHSYSTVTNIGTNILLMVVIAFVVGLSISGQTFYTFKPTGRQSRHEMHPQRMRQI